MSATTPDRDLRALEGAREFLTPRGRWMQGSLCHSWDDPTAPKCACLLGALVYADTGDLRSAEMMSYTFPGLDPLKTVTGKTMLAQWNDGYRRRKGQVLKALDAAIKLRKEQLAAEVAA